LTGIESLAAIAEDLSIAARTLARWFEPFWSEPLPEPQRIDVSGLVLIVDGVRLARGAWVLLGRTLARVALWVFSGGESTAAWLSFTTQILGVPWAVVLDGRAGLLAAVQVTWPTVLIQRCHFHLMQGARNLLTKQPKTAAGQIIRRILLSLKRVRTRRQKRRWLRIYRQWERRFALFLDERTISNQRTPTGRQRWWYTHTRLRRVRSLVRNALPHLFTYVRYPTIPRTTNHVEGGLNSRFAELVHRHRGLPITRKQRLAALFFGSKQ
jgi:transposase-like protein